MRYRTTRRRRRGQSLVEVAMLLAGVSVVAIPAMTALRRNIELTLRREAEAITVASPFQDSAGPSGSAPSGPSDSSTGYPL